MSGNLVSVILRNGLGNRIFQILAALGYAEANGKTVVLCSSFSDPGTKDHEKNTDKYLVRIFPDISYTNTFSKFNILQERQYFKYDPLPNIKTNVLLRGYFQCPKYFPSKLPIIKTKYYPNTYFIHVRGGDYVNHPDEWGLDLVKYYKKCISQIESSAKYIVFSNDTAYANMIMKQCNIEYTVSNTTDPVDSLIEMANCSGGICVNSTFGWLGALFQGDTRGKIFMPSIWNKIRDSRGVYPEWATIVDC